MIEGTVDIHVFLNAIYAVGALVLGIGSVISGITAFVNGRKLNVLEVKVNGRINDLVGELKSAHAEALAILKDEQHKQVHMSYERGVRDGKSLVAEKMLDHMNKLPPSGDG